MIASPFQWKSYAITHQGNVRDHNEDSCLDAGESGMWVVADGMGGHEQGDYASQTIVERLSRIKVPPRPSEFVDLVEDTLLEINRHLFEKSSSAAEPTIIGSTVVALLAFGGYGMCVWAGDSRAYLLRDSKLSQVSRDHSEVQTLVDQGLVKPEDAESHPQANVITRAVGGGEDLFLDYALCELAANDRFLLCSDGLFKDVLEDEIQQHLSSGTCEDSAKTLLTLALSRECKDNVTVIVIDMQTQAERPIDSGAGREASPDKPTQSKTNDGVANEAVDAQADAAATEAEDAGVDTEASIAADEQTETDESDAPTLRMVRKPKPDTDEDAPDASENEPTERT